MGKLAIETRGLKKRFGKTHAVAGVDLAVSAGGVYGVLGPNGAGKTTTIRMLATLTGRSCLPHFRAGVCERTMDEYEDPEFPR
jgi:ABC-type Fe3+/spermidine/putrescine transport system ATPase subunit